VLLNAALANRAGYANAFADGLGVTEAAGSSQAGDEIHSVMAEIKGIIT
jgi:chromosome partitioning protein